MTSQKPITFDTALQELNEYERFPGDPLTIRPNTQIVAYEVDGLANMYKVAITLYGETIATLFADGSVLIGTGFLWTNTTRNRLNDVLAPMGHKIRVINRQWHLAPLSAASEDRWKDFRENMIIEPRPGSKVFAEHSTH